MKKQNLWPALALFFPVFTGCDQAPLDEQIDETGDPAGEAGSTDPGDETAEPGAPGDFLFNPAKAPAGCNPAAPGCKEGQALGKKLNKPAHFKSLKVSGGMATFTVSGHLIETVMFPNGEASVYYQFSIQPKGYLGLAPLAAISAGPNSFAEFYEDTLAEFRLDAKTRENILLGMIEVVSHKNVVSDVFRLPGMNGCDKAAGVTRVAGNRIAEYLVGTDAAVFVSNVVETSAWKGLGKLCPVEAPCSAKLECLITGYPLAGEISCEGNKGFSNKCTRYPDQRKVICEEFDERGKKIGEAVSVCIAPAK